MNSATRLTPARALPVDSYEDLLQNLTDWLRSGRLSRRLALDTNSLGFTAKLYESDCLQATGRGRSADEAIDHAMQEVGAL